MLAYENEKTCSNARNWIWCFVIAPIADFLHMHICIILSNPVIAVLTKTAFSEPVSTWLPQPKFGCDWYGEKDAAWWILNKVIIKRKKSLLCALNARLAVLLQSNSSKFSLSSIFCYQNKGQQFPFSKQSMDFDMLYHRQIPSMSCTAMSEISLWLLLLGNS